MAKKFKCVKFSSGRKECTYKNILCRDCQYFLPDIKVATPFASTNSVSPNLSLDAMEMVLTTGGDCSDDLWHHAQAEFQAIKDFIAAQLRA